MEPITAAILAVLPGLASDAVKGAYEGLKAVIRRKWGEGAPIAKAITALEEDPSSKAQAAVLEEIGGVVQIEARLRPATQEREGRNPATGETITIAAKPASVAVKARPLAKAKNAVPPVSALNK